MLDFKSLIFMIVFLSKERIAFWVLSAQDFHLNVLYCPGLGQIDGRVSEVCSKELANVRELAAD